MNSRASTVMRLLDDLRRLDAGEDINRKENVNGTATPAEEHTRPPKRPWEDMARDGEAPSSASYADVSNLPPCGVCLPDHRPQAPGHHPDEQAQSTAEQDMQIIRNKRQSSAGGAQPGQQKNKYRKRSVSKGLAVSHRSSRSVDVQRATPPGKCHSCNIRETPEWRRGPDGARTLCNACGLRKCPLCRIYRGVTDLWYHPHLRLCEAHAQARQSGRRKWESTAHRPADPPGVHRLRSRKRQHRQWRPQRGAASLAGPAAPIAL